jgi:hypothetical protein
MNRKGKPYSQPDLSHRLTKLLGCSCNVLRSVYVSDKYKDVPKDLTDTAAKMGHSVDVALRVYKKN